MDERSTFNKFLIGIRDFFPIHLLLSQFKHNLIGVLYWVLLFAIITDNFGSSFGVPSLFYSPEYLGETNFMSFLILGFSVGGFIMAFHTYSYIRLGPKYPIIATLNRPFYKFCINNSVIPIVFTILFVMRVSIFQVNEELATMGQVVYFMFAFLLGNLIFLTLSMLYFFPTNKDFFKISGKNAEDVEPSDSNIKTSFHRKQKWIESFTGKNEHRYYYIGKGFKIKRSRSYRHYDKEILEKVFAQNHVNASIFEITIVVSFFFLGFFRAYEFVHVPAGASIMLLFTIVLMLVSAFFSWFRLWTYPVLIVLIFLMNYLSKEIGMFQFTSYAYGLNYETEEFKEYNYAAIQASIDGIQEREKDKLNYIELLENWKKSTGEQYPKLVIINSSGGGLRSCLWTFNVLQKLDSLSQDDFSENLQLITGASGGMIGGAYYRELMLQQINGNVADKSDEKYAELIAQDLLNGIAFSISTNDIFLRYQHESINGYEYTIDRGYAFEEQLIQNTEGILNKNLGDYKEPEFSGQVPVMLFSPTIINDGRRLLISSQPLGFMQLAKMKNVSGMNPGVENIEYNKFYKEYSPENTRFTSVLRMNATFPYIMPMVTLPTKPAMQIMDAGIRDNYGSKTSSQIIAEFSDWINKNTSGVVIVKIRDTRKILKDKEADELSMLDKITVPFGNVYGNFPRVQDFDQDQLLDLSTNNYDFPVDIISFNLRESYKDKIALSWHLTKQEKLKIKKAFWSDENQAEVTKLMTLLNSNNGGK